MSSNSRRTVPGRVCAIQSILLLSSLGLLLTACGPETSPPESSSKVLARVGSHEISVREFQEEIARRTARHQPLPDKQTLLDEMIAYRAQVERARQIGLEQDPEVTRLYENLLIGRLRKQQLDEPLANVEITDDELRAAYRQNLPKYTQPAKARLAILYRKKTASTEQNSATRRQLQEARQLAQNQPPEQGRGPATTGFGALAINQSEDQTSRYKGGDIGWIDVGRRGYRWPDPVIDTGVVLAKNDISDVIEAGDGFYLVMKTDERPETVTPFNSVQTALRHQLLTVKRKALDERFTRECRQRAHAEVYPNALDDLDLSQVASQNVSQPQQVPPSFPQSSR